MTKDMTVGSPMKLVLGFTVPLMFGNLFQQFYSMVDTIIVGKFLGTGPPGGGGVHRLGDLPHFGVLHGGVHRVYHPGVPAVRL